MALTITPPSAPSPARPDTQHPRLSLARIPVSATLAANETLDERRRRGEPVLPLAFGEAGLPAHRTLRAALARAAGCNSYGPVAGHASLREAAAGYWARRGLPTDADAVICGPGSKALLFGLMAAIGGPGRRRRDPAQLGQLRRAGRPVRAEGTLRAGHGRSTGRGPASQGGDGGASGGQPDPFGHSDAPRQPDRPAGPGRGRAGPLFGGRGARPGHHLGRDLPGPGPRSGRAVHQSRRHQSRTDGGYQRAEQEPRPGRLAPRRGQAARRRVRVRAARPAARHRQRDLVRPGRAGAAGRRARLQRAAGGGRPGRAQPPPARVGGPGGGAHVRRGRGRGARAAGGVLRLPGLLAAGRRAARAARHHQRRGPGRDAAARVRRGGAAGQRVRRGRRAAAAAGGHGHALRRHRRPSGSPR